MRSSILATVLVSIVQSGAVSAQNRCLDLTGTPAWVNVTHQASLVPATGFTIEAWCLLQSTAASVPHVVRKNPGSFAEAYSLRRKNGICQFVISGNEFYSTTPFPVGSWHHFAGTYDLQSALLYLDGVQIGQWPLATSLNMSAGVLLFGMGEQTPDHHWPGTIDEVRLWRRARTQAEIQSTMGVELHYHPDLVAAWHFDGTLQDGLGSHHGTAAGGAVAYANSTGSIAPSIQVPSLNSIGSPVAWLIRNQVPGVPYIFDASITGSAPGIPLPPPLGGYVPLNPPLLHYTYGLQFSGSFSGFVGTFDAEGTATPWVDVPAAPALIGIQVDAALAFLSPSVPNTLVSVSSAVSTTLIPPGPVATGIQPPTAPVSGGMQATITGTGFAPGTTVRFDGVLGTGTIVPNAQTIICTVPPGNLGPAVVAVTNLGFTNSVLPSAFSYVETLTLASVLPVSAPAGATISVEGAGFQPGLTLLVGGMPVTPVSTSASSLAFVNPSGVPCGSEVRITNPDAQTAALPFNSPPVIQQLFTANGPSAGGGTFFALGQGFHSGTTVTVGGTAAAILYASLNVLLIVAPPGAPGPATIVLTSPSGCMTQATYVYL